MWEDIYQVYEKHGVEGKSDLRASDMTLHDACTFITAVFENSYNDLDLIFEIRRQPRDYGKYKN